MQRITLTSNAPSLLVKSSYHSLTTHYPDISSLETAAKYSLGAPWLEIYK